MKGFKKWLEKHNRDVNRRKADDYASCVIIILVIALSFIFYVAVAN